MTKTLPIITFISLKFENYVNLQVKYHSNLFVVSLTTETKIKELDILKIFDFDFLS